MKYIKTFEKKSNIKVGEYVLLYYDYIPFNVPFSIEKDFIEYFNNKIGKVVQASSVVNLITIEYEDTEPVECMFSFDNTIVVPDIYVKYVGDSPEDIELQKEMDIYNI